MVTLWKFSTYSLECLGYSDKKVHCGSYIGKGHFIHMYTDVNIGLRCSYFS